MSLIRQEEVYPAVSIPWAQALECRAGTGGVAQYDIVVINSVAATGSVIPKAVKADADGALLNAGIMMIATGAADADGKFLAVPWVVITGLDTNAATAAGYPVYLSAATAGGWTVTKPSGADDAVVPVGTVLVDDATNGAIMLKPGGGADAGFVKVGTAAVVTAGVTVALGANFANGRAVATWAEDPGADQSLFATINGSGNLVITPTAAVTGSKNCTFVAYSGAL